MHLVRGHSVSDSSTPNLNLALGITPLYCRVPERDEGRGFTVSHASCRWQERSLDSCSLVDSR
jgi:hypothetical protein